MGIAAERTRSRCGEEGSGRGDRGPRERARTAKARYERGDGL